jgi:hypothetical protein
MSSKISMNARAQRRRAGALERLERRLVALEADRLKWKEAQQRGLRHTYSEAQHDKALDEMVTLKRRVTGSSLADLRGRSFA